MPRPVHKKKTYQIWVEGYAATGEHSPASCFGEEAGTSFKEACITFFAKESKHDRYFDPERMTYWGCRLFDNRADAQKSFG